MFIAVRTGLTESLISTDIQSVIMTLQEKHPALHLLYFYVFPIGIFYSIIKQKVNLYY